MDKLKEEYINIMIVERRIYKYNDRMHVMSACALLARNLDENLNFCGVGTDDLLIT